MAIKSQHFLKDIEKFGLLDESISILVYRADELVDLIRVCQSVHVQLREHIRHQSLHLFTVQSSAVVVIVSDEDHIHDLP